MTDQIDRDIMAEIQGKVLDVTDNLLDRLDKHEISNKGFLLALQSIAQSVSGFLDTDTVKIISEFMKEAQEKEDKICQS